MFSIKEQKGLIVLIILITITLLSKYLTGYKEVIKREKFTIDSNIEIIDIKSYLPRKRQDTLSKTKQILDKNTTQTKIKKDKTAKTIIEFDFNPNTISFDSLIMMGIDKKTAYNWTKYISKGGKFRIKKDIRKIYGLKENDFFRIKKHILLPDSIKSNKSVAIHKYEKKKYRPQNDFVIELNSCTAGELKRLNGIGEKLSVRIIKFRNKLGGFYCVEQLKEVYGLPVETYDKIKGNLTVDKNKIKKIKINLEDKNSLTGFPYFTYRLAIQLQNYRRQHGYFKSIDDLKNLKTLDNNKIKKIEPYLDFAEN